MQSVHTQLNYCKILKSNLMMHLFLLLVTLNRKGSFLVPVSGDQNMTNSSKNICDINYIIILATLLALHDTCCHLSLHDCK